MKMLVFNTHDELTLSFLLLFQNRLYIDIYLADTSWTFLRDKGLAGVHFRGDFPEGAFINSPKDFGVMSKLVKERQISYQEWLDDKEDWIIMNTLPSWETVMDELVVLKPKSKILCYAGNDYWTYPTKYKNLISAAIDSYRDVPQQNKVYYYPEIDETIFYYTPLKQENSKIIRQYSNFIQQSQPNDIHNGGKCFVCNAKYTDSRTADLWTLFQHCECNVPEAKFLSHGLAGRDGQVCSSDLYKLGFFCRQSALTFHVKVFEGYGFNMLHSLACGRPIITDSIWLRTKSLGKFIIDGETGFFADYRDSDSFVKAIRTYLSNYEEQVKICRNTHETYKVFFNWEEQAFKVKKVLENL